MENRRIPVLLDGDPGHDDAVAWVLAQASGRFDILSVTSVGGNQTLEKTTMNGRRICALAGIDAPFGRGAERPLQGGLITAAEFHGVSGLDGARLPEPHKEADKRGAVKLMADTIRGYSGGKVTIIATGPLTNVASLLLSEPESRAKIDRISIMGGGLYSGNWTPAAEFNILDDPEAAKIVFESGIPITMSPLDVTNTAIVLPEDISRIEAVDNEVAHTVAQWIRFFIRHCMELGYAGATLHDPCAVLTLICPELFCIEPRRVYVETEGMYTRGCTIGARPGIDFYGKKLEANAEVALSVDREGFVDTIISLLHEYDGRKVF